MPARAFHSGNETPSWIRPKPRSKENDDLRITSFPVRYVHAALFAALTIPSLSGLAQAPGGSSARYIPSEIEKSDARVTQLIAKAEDHFRKGKLNLEDNKRDQARDEFDKAVDTILESGMDVRGSQKLQTFYLELV